MSVKRYELTTKYRGNESWDELEENPEGAYVRHGDYAALEQRLIESERYGRQTDITIDNLEMKLAQMAAELASVKQQEPKAWFIRITDEVTVDAREGEKWRGVPLVRVDVETPNHDAFLAEVRASAIPEGYVLVPQQIFLEPSDIESICSQCGDGHESGFGDFTDGLLWVGNIQRDDGSIVHGLHISSADYPEEGGVTVCEFATQLRKGVQS